MGKSFRISADIGGTFTDIIFQNSKTGTCGALKVLSTPENPAEAVITGIDKVVGPDDTIDFFVHGTTVGLNALLTRNGAKVALLTNENFRDAYTIQGNDRGEIFSIRWKKPKPLVSVDDTFTVRGRVDAEGNIDQPLSREDLDAFVMAARARNYEAIAISFLFSFKNPAHELEAKQYLEEQFPDLTITMSHVVSPEWREYERTSTTVMDAYLAPVVRKYLQTLVGKLGTLLPEGHGIHVMETNGGIMTARSASAMPLQTLLSGPVGGAIGGRSLSKTTGRKNLICVDMGGTSFDASLVIDGRPSVSNSAVLEGLPIQISAIDIHVIGAGGGSVAWQEASALRVGPKSAGSTPGPVCYGRGGTEPTVSDANLVLGRLDGANFSGGDMNLDYDAAASALAELGTDFGLDATQMAKGIVDIVNAKMADAIRTITVQRGLDPREFALVAFGGAGPAQAVALAADLDIGEVIIPAHPGAFSAWGMLQTDMQHDYKETFYSLWDAVGADVLEAAFSKLEEKGRAFLTEEGIAQEQIAFERAIDLRYLGQEYVLTIPVLAGEIDMDGVRQAFDAAYLRQYGHSSPENQVEMTNIRVAALGVLNRPKLAPAETADPRPARERDVYFADGMAKTKIVDRNSLRPNVTLYGPAIIEEVTTTTLVPPNWTVDVIEGGHLSLRREV